MIDIKHIADEIVRSMTNLKLTQQQKEALNWKTKIILGNELNKLEKNETLKNYNIYAEGYCANETEGKYTDPVYMGKALARSFEEACIYRFRDDKFFDKENLTYWGCKLYSK